MSNRIKDADESNESSEESTESIASGSRKIPSSVERLRVPLKKVMLIQTALLKALKHFLVVPFSATCELEEWVNHRYLKCYANRNIEYQHACDQLHRETQLFTFNQLNELYQNGEPYWRSREKLLS